MPSELTASYPEGTPIVAVEATRARLPTQMGATLDGVPKSRKRGLAVIGITAACVVAIGIGVIVVKTKEAPVQAAGAETTNIAAATGAQAGVVAPPPPTVDVAQSAAPAVTASASAAPATSAAPSATAQKAPAHPPGWKPPPPPPPPPKKGHGF